MDYRHLKSLIESFLTEANLQTLNRTYGVEFEMCFKKDVVRKYVEENPSLENISYDIDVGGTNAWNNILSREGFGNWQVHQDSSITASYNKAVEDYDISIEIVTPILSGAEGLAEINRFLSTFVPKLGGYVNDSCGGHVHIGAKDLLQGTERQVANKFIIGLLTAQKFTPLLRALVPEERRYSDWAEPVSVDPVNIGSSLSNAREDVESARMHVANLINLFASDRYKTINFKSLYDKGTIEFRIFDGTLNYSLIEQRVKFGTAFVNALAESEIDLTKNIKSLKDNFAEATKKGPRTEQVKSILRSILSQNISERTDMISTLQWSESGTPSSIYSTLYEELREAIAKYPLYRKPVNLLEHRIIVDCRTAQKLRLAEKYLRYSGHVEFDVSGTKVLILPVKNKEAYRRVISRYVSASTVNKELLEKGISPEEFLSQFDVAEAEPYVASYEKYKKEMNIDSDVE